MLCHIVLLQFCCRDRNLRERKRLERKERMTQQVQEIKRKQQAAESWQRLKRSILQHLTIGIGVGVLLLGGAIAYSYFTSRVWDTGSVDMLTDLLGTDINQVPLPGLGFMKLKLSGHWIVELHLTSVIKIWIYIYI